MGPIEAAIRRSLSGADVSREGWEAGWEQEGHEAPPIGEGDLARVNLLGLASRQRRAIPLLALDRDLAGEVDAMLDQAAKSRPLALGAAVHGPIAVTPEALLGDLAEALATHREAILRVASADLADDLEALFAQAPVPDRSASDLHSQVRGAADINSEALILIARAIDGES